MSNEAILAFAAAAGKGADPAAMADVRVYDNLFHEMFLEPERDQVIAALVAWTTARITA